LSSSEIKVGAKQPVTRRSLLKAASGAALLPLAGGTSLFSWSESALAEQKPSTKSPVLTVNTAAQRRRWVEYAESLKPKLKDTPQLPVSIVSPVSDSSLFLRWRMDAESKGADLSKRLLHKGDQFILDFEGHRTGNFEFRLVGEGRSVDSPVRLKLTFGEVPGDVAEPFDPYRGQLSSAWLPEEIITIDFLPQRVRMPRRYAFRYVKVEVIDTSPNFGIRFFDTKAIALTSASKQPAALPAGTPDWVVHVDQVALATLRDCMQTTFEDGPRRDQRLWIGDLRLQAQASYVTFPNHDLVKRCLYLFAGLPRESDGFLPACVFEKPTPSTTDTFILDYAALYGAIVLDYVKASNDIATARELWPVAYRQFELLFQYVDDQGLFQIPKGYWAFIDWNMKLDRSASMQGVIIYAGRRLCKLAELTGNTAQIKTYSALLDKMTKAAHETYYSMDLKVCISGPDKQVSWASQAWLTLAGCLSKEEAAEALRRAVFEDKASIQPATAYLYHHVTQAMIECGMQGEALQLIKKYWGGMVEAGADTFWEAYDPNDSNFSPYGDVHINSFCHAWSCTPTYFFRASKLTE
jgi:alpha-L-rhamnosidase